MRNTTHRFATLLTLVCSLALAAPALAADGALKVVSIDMEGGGGTLFVAPDGTSLLVDTGWPSNFGLLPSPDGAKNSALKLMAAALLLAFASAPSLARAGTINAAPVTAAGVAEIPGEPPANSAPGSATLGDTADYAAREAAAPQLG